MSKSIIVRGTGMLKNERRINVELSSPDLIGREHCANPHQTPRVSCVDFLPRSIREGLRGLSSALSSAGCLSARIAWTPQERIRARHPAPSVY